MVGVLFFLIKSSLSSKTTILYFKKYKLDGKLYFSFSFPATLITHGKQTHFSAPHTHFFFFFVLYSLIGWLIISSKMRGKKPTCLRNGSSIKSHHLEENCLWGLLNAICFAFLFLNQVITLIKKKDVSKITDLICNQTITCTVLLEATKNDIKQSGKHIE